MGFFDSFKGNFNNTVNNISNSAANAVKSGSYKRETFTFASLPQSVEQLQALPEYDLTTPFKTAALVMAVLCNYENDVNTTIDMINALKGPQPLSTYEKQFLRDRLVGKSYVPRSYFAGTSPQNNYTPTTPYTITISEQAYSYSDEGYAKLFINSSGADSPRYLKMRRKGNQWFLWENFALSDIRIPAEADPWA